MDRVGKIVDDRLIDLDEVRDLDPSTPGTQNPFDLLDPDTTGDNFQDSPDGKPDGWNDYDGDGMSNRDELTCGYNPLDPDSWTELPLLPIIGGFLLALLFFATGFTVVRPRKQG